MGFGMVLYLQLYMYTPNHQTKGIAPTGLPRGKPQAIAECVAAIVAAGAPGLTPQEMKVCDCSCLLLRLCLFF